MTTVLLQCGPMVAVVFIQPNSFIPDLGYFVYDWWHIFFGFSSFCVFVYRMFLMVLFSPVVLLVICSDFCREMFTKVISLSISFFLVSTNVFIFVFAYVHCM